MDEELRELLGGWGADGSSQVPLLPAGSLVLHCLCC